MHITDLFQIFVLTSGFNDCVYRVSLIFGMLRLETTSERGRKLTPQVCYVHSC